MSQAGASASEPGSLRSRRGRAALALVLSLVCLPALGWLRFDTRPAAALPATSPEAKRFATLAGFLSEREAIVFMLCGEDQASSDAAFLKATSTWDLGTLYAGASADDAEMLLSQALALWPEDDFAGLKAIFDNVDARVAELRAQAELIGGGALLAQAQRDPLGLGRALLQRLGGQQSAMRVGPDMRLHVGECRVAFLLPRAPSSDRAFVHLLASEVASVRQAVPRLFATGPHLYAAEYDDRLSHGLWRSGLLSILAVLAVCYLLFRDFVAIALVGTALAVASGWTLGAATLILGNLQILAVSAASILPAVGIDAGIQFYVHRKMTRAIYVAAAASALSFVTFAFAETRAFRQFGVLLALGVVANTLAMATLLPLLFGLAERLGWTPRTASTGWVERVGSALGALPKRAGVGILVGAAVPLVLLFHAPPQHLGFSALIDSTLDAAKAQKVFERVFGASDRHLFVATEASSEDEAVTWQKQLRLRTPGVTSDGGPLLLPTRADLARALQWRRQLDPERTARLLRQRLAGADFNTDPFEGGLQSLASLGLGEPRLPALAQLGVRQRVGRVADGGAWALTSLFVSPSVDGPATLASLRAELPSHSHLVGPFPLDLELKESLLADGQLLAGLAVIAVIAALLLARMSARRLLSVLSALVLIFAFLWLSLGTLQLPLTLVTLLVIPFVLGIGIDASVYLAEHDAFTSDRRSLLREHLRPLLASTLTTLAGFACLVFVDLEQIRLLGVCVAVGLAWALAVALLWIPLFAP